ncbi:sterile alpha motif domain-containing protein 10-like isoform X3 [Hyperolius riggenbachi]|uniref:sterile alpha motif domain-containing protein 10-like isoform X3 n=1 Tax=Hyperolius riggenbachi TaxID=752182 RepID=UPI0035A2BA04
MFTDLRARIGEREAGGRGDYSPERGSMDAAAHFRFCRNLLEHTVSTENLNHRFRREIGNSLTWHDGRGNRTSGGRAIKLLKQPGTDISQLPPTSGSAGTSWSTRCLLRTSTTDSGERSATA